MKTNDKYRGDLQVGNVSYKDDMLYKIDEIRKRTNATYEAAKLPWRSFGRCSASAGGT